MKNLETIMNMIKNTRKRTQGQPSGSKSVFSHEKATTDFITDGKVGENILSQR